MAAAAAGLRYLHLCSVSSAGSSGNLCTHLRWGVRHSIQCSDSTPPNPRGFGPKSNKKPKSSPKQSSTVPNQAPGLNAPTGGGRSYTSSDDLEFEQRLQNVRRLALEQKKTVEKEDGPIDYDAPTPTKTNSSANDLGIKVGVGVAVFAFGLVFAFGDIIPSGSVSPTEEAATVTNTISEEERSNLESRLKEFEATLSTSPEDSTALEGAAVTLAELGEYKRAAQLLEKLTEKKQTDSDAFRLLGEVKYEMKDYEGSVLAYKSAEKASKDVDFEILRGFTNSLLAAKRPDEAVQVLLASRERVNKENSSGTTQIKPDDDSIQIDLLLGKAYADWGHITDALTVYDQLISNHSTDFRGYLAKGIILKEIGSKGDAERMFIQARFFAPDKAKVLVDKYSR